jgi:hypothetical protein
MLDRIDRVLLAVPDAAPVAGRWCTLLDAEVVRQDRVPALGARRIVVTVGDAEVEVLEPDGAGPVARHVASGRGGPFAAGVALAEPDRLLRHLAGQGMQGIACGNQHFLDAHALGIPGLAVMVSPLAQRATTGLMNNLYEVTHLTPDPQASAAAIARVFGLERSVFVPIRSEQFGYDGELTLFKPDALHRIETIHPFDSNKTMGRFFGRFGPALYMCYGETDRLPELRDRLEAQARDGWTGSRTDDDVLFVHPKTLGGVMLGVSRTTYAWSWSGHPERVIAAG